MISWFNFVPCLGGRIRLSALASVAIFLALPALCGCGSGVVGGTQAGLTAVPVSFSPALNATSVFIGASIIHNWPLPIHNDGISGQTTSQILSRFRSDVVAHGYARVIILCGTNDIIQNTPNVVEEASANLQSMAQIASDAGLEVVLSELPPAVHNGVDLNPTVQTLNASIAQIAADHRYLVVDYFTPMEGHPEYFIDSLHPNATGYAVMEKALAAVVRH